MSGAPAIGIDLGTIYSEDLIPLSLGIQTEGGKMYTMIQRNTKIPVKKTKSFSTEKDNQTFIIFKIFEGENALTKYNNLIGTIDLIGILPAPKGVPEIQVTFDIDSNGILNVTVLDKSSGNQNEITIKRDEKRLDKIEIERMIRVDSKRNLV